MPRTSNTPILWVSPHFDEWHVQTDGADRPEALFDAREDAVEWACRVAQRQSPGIVRVVDYHGNITSQFFFADITNDLDRRPAA